jgi:hypothetical protein
MKNLNVKQSGPATVPLNTKLAYTRQELAALLGVSTKSLRRLELRGLLKPSKAFRKKLYAAKAVHTFLEETV